MTLFGEFHFELGQLPLGESLSTLPDTVVEIERVIASGGVLTPYFWVTTPDFDEFETVAKQDSSLVSFERMDVFNGDALYRAEWAKPIEKTIYECIGDGIVALEASGDRSGWEFRLRFDDREHLMEFQSFCGENDIPFVLKRLYRESQPMTAGQYGLTDKQQEALVACWKAGYFQSPQEVTLSEVAESLGITRQSLSQRLRRAHHALIANTLIVTPPEGERS